MFFSLLTSKNVQIMYSFEAYYIWSTANCRLSRLTLDRVEYSFTISCMDSGQPNPFFGSGRIRIQKITEYETESISRSFEMYGPQISGTRSYRVPFQKIAKVSCFVPFSKKECTFIFCSFWVPFRIFDVWILANIFCVIISTMFHYKLKILVLLSFSKL